jgi:hypothetical protein
VQVRLEAGRLVIVHNWRAMMVVCEKGEMRQGYARGKKPAAAG